MKRSMGLDIGTRTIGVATSDLLGMIAGGVETIRRTTEERAFESMKWIRLFWATPKI